MDNEIIITLAGIAAGFFIAAGFVIRHIIIKKEFPWQKKKG